MIFADAVTVSNILSLDDQVRFKQMFYDAMPFKDLETAGYSVMCLKLMKAEVPPTQVFSKKLCSTHIQKTLLTTKWYHFKEALKTFHLSGNTEGFHLWIQKLEPPCASQ